MSVCKVWEDGIFFSCVLTPKTFKCISLLSGLNYQRHKPCPKTLNTCYDTYLLIRLLDQTVLLGWRCSRGNKGILVTRIAMLLRVHYTYFYLCVSICMFTVLNLNEFLKHWIFCFTKCIQILFDTHFPSFQQIYMLGYLILL